MGCLAERLRRAPHVPCTTRWTTSLPFTGAWAPSSQKSHGTALGTEVSFKLISGCNIDKAHEWQCHDIQFLTCKMSWHCIKCHTCSTCHSHCTCTAAEYLHHACAIRFILHVQYTYLLTACSPERHARAGGRLRACITCIQMRTVPPNMLRAPGAVPQCDIVHDHGIVVHVCTSFSKMKL